MRTALVVLLAVTFSITLSARLGSVAAVELAVTVTSAADSLEDQACPDATKCTLRAAIDYINADAAEAGGPYVINFDTTVFPTATPTTITIGDVNLPVVTQTSATIDASSAGVIIRGAGVATVGLEFSGTNATVIGLVVQDFTSACLRMTGVSAAVGGDPTAGEGNLLGGCAEAIEMSGSTSIAHGNEIGWDTDGSAADVSVGIDASGETATVGGIYPNLVGNATTGILSEAAGASIRRNTVGFSADGAAAQVVTGISSVSADAVIGNLSNPVSSNIVGNATTGIFSSGGDVKVVGNLVGFAGDGTTAPVDIGIHIAGESAVVGDDDNETMGNRVGNADTGLLVAGESASVFGTIVGVAPGGAAAPVDIGIHVAGESAALGDHANSDAGNVVGNAETGILITATGATLFGTTVGLGLDGSAAPVETGIAVEAAGATIGHETEDEDANTIGNAGVAIRVGTDDGDESFEGVRIVQNWLGRTEAGVAHPVETGVLIRKPDVVVEVLANHIANVTGSGIVTSTIGVDTAGVFEGNIFEAIGELSIDLDGDGIRNPNDDDGPDGLLDHPVIQVATQGLISGTTGPACAGAAGKCTVFLYNTDHTPGGLDDYATSPVPLGSAATASDGDFSFENPPVAPGKWIMAIVVLTGTATSEASPSVRVGSGSVACGNEPLFFGWNHSPYLGAQPLQLGLKFPAGSGESDTSAIFELVDGTANYNSWFADTVIGRTLSTLVPGEAYWFHANENTVLPGGFAVTQAVPVELEEGWNDFVYLGASTDVADALASLEGEYTALYRFVNDGFTERWELYGAPDTPDYVRDFTTLEACNTYWIKVADDVTLTPPHP